ncbi:MAG: hypothetical protein C6Y22_30605 [Hapalosiphonaceae cyanobacterium JJU2]|nr:MAG: hypothetical protein C6Y22_30605 [Hapalosiphonaceae cyanobacterium JJU2]
MYLTTSKQLDYRIDVVFLPKSNPSSPIYFVEVKFQPDKMQRLKGDTPPESLRNKQLKFTKT